MSIEDTLNKVHAVNLLVISMQYPMERFMRHNDAAVTVAGLTSLMPDNSIESYCKACLKQSEEVIAEIEKAIAEYRKMYPNEHNS